jgi:hypothetical protein
MRSPSPPTATKPKPEPKTHLVKRGRKRHHQRRPQKLLRVDPVRVQHKLQRARSGRQLAQDDLGVVLEGGHLLVLAEVGGGDDPWGGGVGGGWVAVGWRLVLG